MIVKVISGESLEYLDISDLELLGSVSIPFSSELSLSCRMSDPKLAINDSFIDLMNLNISGHRGYSHYTFEIRGLMYPVIFYMVSDHYYSEFVIE